MSPADFEMQVANTFIEDLGSELERRISNIEGLSSLRPVAGRFAGAGITYFLKVIAAKVIAPEGLHPQEQEPGVKNRVVRWFAEDLARALARYGIGLTVREAERQGVVELRNVPLLKYQGQAGTDFVVDYDGVKVGTVRVAVNAGLQISIRDVLAGFEQTKPPKVKSLEFRDCNVTFDVTGPANMKLAHNSFEIRGEVGFER